jgi:hypothetical protein
MSWGSEAPQKDAEIRALRAQLSQLQK